MDLRMDPVFLFFGGVALLLFPCVLILMDGSAAPVFFMVDSAARAVSRMMPTSLSARIWRGFVVVPRLLRCSRK